jgi:trehalose 6-phosphate phosphatase
MVKGWRDGLVAALPGGWAGIVEDKKFSLTLHYRSPVAKKQALAALGQVAPEAGWFGGKRVINLVPKDAPDKGNALRHLMGTMRCEAAVFFGDDVTDEHAFRLAKQSPRAESRYRMVRVGRKRESFADYFLKSQLEMDRLLEFLVELNGGTKR